VVEAGTDNFGLLLAIVSFSPPAGAGPASVKEQVLLCPAVRAAGKHDIAFGGARPIVKLANCPKPLNEAVTFTVK
jgi:hypothetical protein